MSNGIGAKGGEWSAFSTAKENDSNDRSGLESIALVALQALQQQEVRKPSEPPEASSEPTRPNRKPIAPRTVSIETAIGEDDTSSETSSLTPPPPRTQEKGTESKARKSPTADLPSTDPEAAVSAPETSFAPTSTPSTKDDEEAKTADDFSKILADPEAWLLQTENMFAKLAPVDRSTEDIVVQPNDVLCGRGGETNHHPGNVRYRSLVKAYQKLYLLAKRRDKPKIAQCIVVSVRGVNGRFLKRMKHSSKPGPPGWVDVGNIKAREKTSQALREGAPDLRETVNFTIPTGETTAVPVAATTTIAPPTRKEANPTQIPTALEAMMGWRMPQASGNSSDPTAAVTSSSLKQEIENDALTAKAFTEATAKLMQHPIFHQLDPSQQQQAILHELNIAKAKAKATGYAALYHQNGFYPPQYGQFPQDNKHINPDSTSSTSKHGVVLPSQPLYRQGMLATKTDPDMEVVRSTKKRPASSTLSSSPAVVSDTGSEVSSTSSSSSTTVHNDSTTLAKKLENDKAARGGGSRLKRLKLRMQGDFDP